jgi:predicted GNAT family acetyltransferase
MRLHVFDSLEPFAAVAVPFLVANEAAHCLPLGLITTLRTHAGSFEGSPLLATVEVDSGAIAAVVMRTPPHNLILSLAAPEVSESEVTTTALAGLGKAATTLPGVIGPPGMARICAAMWAAKTHRTPTLRTHERIYELTTVTPPQAVPGLMRPITAADRELLVRWRDAFMVEALGTQAPTGSAEMIDLALDPASAGIRAYHIWDDVEPVAFAGNTGPTPSGMRIGPVYTPPERRGNGYASALVAALSQSLLDSGRTRCFLFTDLANPTSNKIYQSVGYEPVIDWDEYQFDA